MIRNHFTLRVIALCFTVEILGTVLWPACALALTNGPNQQEFTSYEPAGTTDMVNLITGDFTYNLPLLEVPSPEGNFSLPLTYHSGIGMEDDATWAGLGWNVNPGCISRARVGSPDDDKDALSNVHVESPGGKGFIKNYVVYQRNWDSQKGYGGAINLSDVIGVSWQSGGIKDFSTMGFTFNKDKVSFSVEKAFNAVNTIASFGAGGPATSVGKEIGFSRASSILSAGNTGMSLAMTTQSLYAGYKSQGNKGGNIGSWQYQNTSSNWGFRQDYKYWLDATRTEHHYGSLYLGHMGTCPTLPVAPIPTAPWDVYFPRIGDPQYPQNAQLAPIFPTV